MSRPAMRLRALTKPAVKPVSGLLDKRFVYVHSTKTDIRETFLRVAAELKTKERKL